MIGPSMMQGYHYLMTSGKQDAFKQKEEILPYFDFLMPSAKWGCMGQIHLIWTRKGFGDARQNNPGWPNEPEDLLEWQNWRCKCISVQHEMDGGISIRQLDHNNMKQLSARQIEIKNSKDQVSMKLMQRFICISPLFGCVTGCNWWKVPLSHMANTR